MPDYLPTVEIGQYWQSVTGTIWKVISNPYPDTFSVQRQDTDDVYLWNRAVFKSGLIKIQD